MELGDAVPNVKLSRANLARLQPPVYIPNYDASRVTAGIVHLGLGGFHRAHMVLSGFAPARTARMM